MVQDEETKIARPRQIYTGHRARDYPAIEGREELVDPPVDEKVARKLASP
jgi:hypothetical protein